MSMQISFVGGALNGQSGTLSGDMVVTIGAAAPPPSIPAPNGVSLIPLMTSPTTSGVAISATSEYSDSGGVGAAWHVGDGIVGSGWYHAWSSTAQATSTAPQDLTIQFATAVPVYEVDITIRSDANTLAPTNGTLDGFDGANWINQRIFSSLSWSLGETKTFAITPTATFSRYRLRWTGSGALCQITELQLKS